MRRPFSDSSPRIPPIHRCFCLLCHEKRSLLLRVYATVQINANIATYPLCKQLFLFASQDYAHNMSYIPLQLLWQVSRILTPMPSGWAISLTGSASIASTTGKLLLELYQSHASLRDVSRFQIGWIFRKVPKRGGGVIFNPKIYIAKFGPLNRAFSAWKWYKKVFWGMFLPYYHVEHLCYMHLMGNRIIKYTNVPPYEHTHFCHNFVAKSAM